MKSMFQNQSEPDLSRNYSLVGTEEYLAPETLLDSDVSYASDLWSLGVIIYQMLMGETPFRGKTPMETYYNIKHKEITQFKLGLDPDARALIKGLLVKDPKDRFGATSISDVLTHPFFDEIDWSDLRSIPARDQKTKNKQIRTTQ